ncbi:MAG: 30S ribosomal protein S4 [Patescibacteria group bacterium]|nr:30S ribosomal protein S4 [Patescibacteria group bacterium]
MGRNLKPRHKATRRFGENVADTIKSPLDKGRNYPSGIHGPKKTFSKTSEYGKQLSEKQKAKAIYGILEKQFRLTFDKARKMPGDLGQNFLTLLENRLDNVIYRAGLAQTRRLARQLVSHGHFTIDGQNNNIPSYSVKPGQVIKVKDNKISKDYWKKFGEKEGEIASAGWLAVDKDKMTITVNSRPNKDELPANIDVPLIVDFYSR